jgi:DNA-binding MarR family transcriptional regulator/L-amino acid N-acyltransferase YncA
MQLSKDKINILRQEARAIVRELGLLNDAYFGIGVTLAERHLLIELSVLESPTFGQIAEKLLLDKSTASRLIAQAKKKGFVSYEIDKIDKRKKLLKLTPFGLETLERFEAIAFRQTEEALLSVNPDEIELVCKGIALYAQGLKNSRLQKRATKSELGSPKSSTLDKVYGELNSLGYTLCSYCEKDYEELYDIFREVVESGSQFPYESSSREEFNRQFFSSGSHVYVCKGITDKIVGGFYLKSNYTGRSDHIANAAYMINSSYRGKGIGSLMIKASLGIAEKMGYEGMQFNMVLSENTGAIRLYERLGFSTVGIIPKAIRNRDGTYQNGHVMYKNLNPLIAI